MRTGGATQAVADQPVGADSQLEQGSEILIVASRHDTRCLLSRSGVLNGRYLDRQQRRIERYAR